MEQLNLTSNDAWSSGGMEMECQKLEEQLLAIHKTILEMRKAAASQKNVNKTTKDGMEVIANAVDAALESKRNLTKIAQVRSYSDIVRKDLGTQTPTNKRTRDKISPLIEETPPKKKRGQTEASDWQIVTKRKGKKGGKTITMDRPDLKATNTTIKTMRKGRDVVLIKPNEGKTYADVLGTLKLKVNSEDT